MVRLSQYEESEREHLLKLPCPTYISSPYVTGLKVSKARIAADLYGGFASTGNNSPTSCAWHPKILKHAIWGDGQPNLVNQPIVPNLPIGSGEKPMLPASSMSCDRSVYDILKMIWF
jgi:hypothetical protein